LLASFSDLISACFFFLNECLLASFSDLISACFFFSQ
jgi:hypothetical protein